MNTAKPVDRVSDRAARLERVNRVMQVTGKLVPAEMATRLIEAVVRPGDRLCLEGDNQKQADFLATALLEADPRLIHDIHMVQSTMGLKAHLDLFRRGIASRIDFVFSGPQAKELAVMVQRREIQIGAIHTYLELFARYFTDLTPRVSLIAAESADRDGNLYTGPHTEETPTDLPPKNCATCKRRTSVVKRRCVI